MDALTRTDSERDWHAWRAQGIGGSDIASILGLSRWGSPYTVWLEKTGRRAPSETTARQRIGLRMESVLADEFHDATGLYVHGQQRLCTHSDWPWARATVDGFVCEHPDTGEAFDPTLDLGTWQAKTDGRFSWPDGVPVSIRAQCIWEMGVTRVPHCWLTVMFAGFRVEHFEIPWDPDAAQDWQVMTEIAERFWTDHVLTDTPPPIDGSDATHDAIAEQWPLEHPGTTVELDALADDVQLREIVQDGIRAAKARQAELTNEIAAAFGDAEIGTIGGVPALTYRAQTRRTVCPNCGHVTESEPFRTMRKAPKQKGNR